MIESWPARAYLLAFRGDQARPLDRRRTGFLVRAAALAELLLGGDIADRNDRAVTGTLRKNADPVLADTFHDAANCAALGWRGLVRKNHARTLLMVEKQLVRADLLVADFNAKPESARLVLRDTELTMQLRTTVRNLLRSNSPNTEQGNGAMVALLAAADIRHMVSRADRRRYRNQIDMLGANYAPVVLGLSRAIEGIHRSLTTTRS